MSAASPLLSVARLTMRFGGLLAIDDLSLDVAARQITGVIGPNGAGKTTFFNCLTGFYKPTIGSIRLNHPQRGVMRLEELASRVLSWLSLPRTCVVAVVAAIDSQQSTSDLNGLSAKVDGCGIRHVAILPHFPLRWWLHGATTRTAGRR